MYSRTHNVPKLNRTKAFKGNREEKTTLSQSNHLGGLKGHFCKTKTLVMRPDLLNWFDKSKYIFMKPWNTDKTLLVMQLSNYSRLMYTFSWVHAANMCINQCSTPFKSNLDLSGAKICKCSSSLLCSWGNKYANVFLGKLNANCL